MAITSYHFKYFFFLSQEFKGPFFNGTNFGYVDVLIAPFIDRLQMLKHFRDFHPTDNIEDGELKRRFWEWDKALRSHPSVSLTIPSLERLVESYKDKYTD